MPVCLRRCTVDYVTLSPQASERRVVALSVEIRLQLLSRHKRKKRSRQVSSPRRQIA
ncbi:hypothetical protein BRI6_4687 [plant metagenome]|uniref:Uncharacterized protein n=1 Tax=plant metagenome TaxID=1297885 RepID=A0A484VES6_9ZZZZ